MNFVAMLIGSLIGAVIAGIIIWIVSKLKLGLEVDNFLWAIIAGGIIAVFSNLILGFIPEVSGWVGTAIHLVVAAVVIFGAGAFLKGLRVNGFVGALIAAGSIAIVNFIAAWLIGLTGLV